MASVSTPVIYDGGAGSDVLRLTGAGGTFASTTYLPGPELTKGRLQYAGAVPMTIDFVNLEPVQDNIPTPVVIVNGPAANNRITLTEGPNSNDGGHPLFIGDTTGFVEVDTFESYEFSNKDSLVLNGGAGADHIAINSNATPTNMTGGVTVNGGQSSTGDTLEVNGVAATLTNDVAAGTLDGAYGTGGLVTVTYTTIESITVIAGASANLAVTGSADYTVNAGSESDQGQVLSSGVPISFDGFGAASSVQLTGGGAITVNGTTADDVFTVSATSGDVQIAGRALIERDGTSTTLNLNGHDGDDTFNVTAAQPYANITLSGGNPGGSDVANLNGDGSSPATVTLEDATSATAARVTGTGLGNVSLPGIEHVNLSSQNDVTVNGTAADDDVSYTTTGAQSGTVTHGATNTDFNLTTVSNLTIDGQGGDNTLTVNGTTAANTFTVNGTAVLLAGLQGVNAYANSAAVTVNGLEGSDIFNVTPSAIPFRINGGDPTSVQPGDALNIFDPVGVNVVFTTGPEPDSGSFMVGANAPVSFDEIESSTVTGAGGGGTTVTIEGTNADDDITVLGTAGNSFNVSVNAGPAIQFNTIDGLTINGMSGDDDIDVELNALDLVNDIAVNGHQPGSGEGDTLTVRGDTGADAPVWTPSAGTLVVSGEVINVGVIESLIYDGESEADTLTITGDGTDNGFAHTPAAARHAGSIDITTGAGTQLGIQYVNLGLASTVAFDGVAGTNNLIANGSSTDDVFDLVVTSGDVNLTRSNGAHVVLTTATISNVTLNGLGGDDTFNVPGPQPYTNITLAGGDPSASDVANLTGDGTGPITVTVSSPATVAGGGLGTVTLSGIEHTNLNADTANVDVNGNTGDDDISFTTTGSDAGTLTNAGLNNEFNLSQVGTLSVDGLGGDNTLTVNGTTAANTFDVNGAAVLISGLQGIDAYSNVAAVTTNGLEGSDTVNVTPSAVLVHVNGGDPTSAVPGDALNIVDTIGQNVTFTPGPEPDSGSFVAGGNAPVSFDEIESSTVTGAGPWGGTTITINGTNADDDITTVGTGANDFNVSVNASPAVQYNGVDGLTINSMSGDDDIDFDLNGLNNLANDITVDAGQPGSSQGDTVTVRGNTGVDNPTYTPVGPNAGTLVLGETLNLSNTENLVYDGEAEDDTLTVNGLGSDDTFVHTPGTNLDDGDIAINDGTDTMLGITYLNLGLGGNLLLDGMGGTDTLVANGTAFGRLVRRQCNDG